MTDADKKLYDKAEELFCQNCKLRTERCLFAYRKVNGIEDCHKSCGCYEVPAWIDGYKEGLKAKINATTISDCPSKGECMNCVNKYRVAVKCENSASWQNNINTTPKWCYEVYDCSVCKWNVTAVNCGGTNEAD